MHYRLGTAFRLALCLALAASCALLCAKSMGYFPDDRPVALKGRIALSEAIAANCSVLAARGQFKSVEQALAFVVERNPDVLSAGLRTAANQLVVEIGPHRAAWEEGLAKNSDGCIFVPIIAGETAWGNVELRFAPLYGSWWSQVVDETFVYCSLVMLGLNAVVFTFCLSRLLRQLNPSNVVPQRVRTALDTIADGIVLLDKEERIVLANRAFASAAGETSERLLGRRLSELPWCEAESAESLPPRELPWERTTCQHRPQAGGTLALAARSDAEGRRVFVVNSSPIQDDRGSYCGALASFGDVTLLEERRQQLSKVLDSLQRSRDEINRQNEELRVLATRDPLTGCLNRRTFFERFELHWKTAARYNQPLSCLIVDIDFFKSINDNHGHSMGDDVLRKVAAALLQTARDSDEVCRYGGEEFCVLLPQTDLNAGHQAAERLRAAIGALEFPQGLKITASLGVSMLGLGATDPKSLLDQADKCLYVAKRNGRNQSVRFDQVPHDTVVDEAKVSRIKPAAEDESSADIPYSAVSALLSALAFRDAETAAHSARVAELAALLGRRYLSAADGYVLEVAALLHDIGKIGVPDAILLKPDKLTPQEWEVMAMHERFGVEIVNTSFQCQLLTDMIAHHHCPYGGDPSRPEAPRGEQIPLGARIIAIVDAYDAMVSDRCYRPGRPMAEALAELRRCAGRQFDPDLVEAFVEVVRRHANEGGDRRQTSRDLALGIGLQIERLVKALDAHDFSGMKALLGRLQTTAQRHNAPEIVASAKELESLLNQEPDLKQLLESTHELLDICRQSHASTILDLKQQYEHYRQPARMTMVLNR